MSPTKLDPGVAEAEHARAELYDTLGQLRTRLDYAQRIDDAMERTCARLTVERRENPIGFGLGVAAVAAAAGFAVWGITKAVIRVFD